MNPSHPICERCGQEIKPGQLVEFVGKTDEELIRERIITEPMILVHAEAKDCPGGEQ